MALPYHLPAASPGPSQTSARTHGPSAACSMSLGRSASGIPPMLSMNAAAVRTSATHQTVLSAFAALIARRRANVWKERTRRHFRPSQMCLSNVTSEASSSLSSLSLSLPPHRSERGLQLANLRVEAADRIRLERHLLDVVRQIAARF